MPGVFDRSLTTLRNAFPLVSSIPRPTLAAISSGGSYLAISFNFAVVGNDVPIITSDGGAVTATYSSGSGSSLIIFELSRAIDDEEVVTLDLAADGYVANYLNNELAEDLPVGLSLTVTSSTSRRSDLLSPLLSDLLSNLLSDYSIGGSGMPVSAFAPVMSGTAEIDETLTVTDGHWFNIGSDITYAWLRYLDGEDSSTATVIAGAAENTYLIGEEDEGYIIFARVRVGTIGGSYAAALSNETADGVSGVSYDSDAAAYIAAVETADGEPLEDGVKTAINNLVIGYKEDGTWSDFGAHQLLCAARTLNGALVPLIGTGPTNFNFVTGDYSRLLGLRGNGYTKYLQSNYPANTNEINDAHMSVYMTQEPTMHGNLIGAYVISPAWFNYLYRLPGTTVSNFSINSTSQLSSIVTGAVNFQGVSKATSGQFQYRYDGTEATSTKTDASPVAMDINVFRRNRNTPDSYTDAKIAIYTLGSAINLGLVRARQVTFMAELGAALA